MHVFKRYPIQYFLTRQQTHLQTFQINLQTFTNQMFQLLPMKTIRSRKPVMIEMLILLGISIIIKSKVIQAYACATPLWNNYKKICKLVVLMYIYVIIDRCQLAKKQKNSDNGRKNTRLKFKMLETELQLDTMSISKPYKLKNKNRKIKMYFNIYFRQIGLESYIVSCNKWQDTLFKDKVKRWDKNKRNFYFQEQT